MEGKVVFEGKTRSGKPVLVRYVKNGDAKLLLEYINTLSTERTFITLQGEKLTLDEEEATVKKWVSQINDLKAVILLAITNDELIGIASLELRNRVMSHVGTFGLSVKKEFRGEGIGKLLTKLALSAGKKSIVGLKIIELKCFAKNFVALNLYRSFGFEKFGELEEGVKYKDGYDDLVYMYKKV